eukprot:13417431-Alexandrium_andersonii.AAC.1
MCIVDVEHVLLPVEVAELAVDAVAEELRAPHLPTGKRRTPSRQREVPARDEATDGDTAALAAPDEVEAEDA